MLIHNSSSWNRLAISAMLVSACTSGLLAGEVSPRIVRNGHTYFMSANRDWNAAEAFAVSLGGHLATVNDEVENAFLVTLSGGSEPWIGLNDRDSEGTFVWRSGEPVTYTNWASGEPNDSGGNEDAVYLGSTGQWNDWSEFDPGPGIIELPFTDCNVNNIDDAADIAAGTSADCNANGTPDECDIAVAEQFVIQWASSVIDFSSQYGDPDYAAAQALGPPDTFVYGDFDTAWTPGPQNGTLEYIAVGYATPVHSHGVTIREISGNGMVYQVDVIDTDDALHTVWTGADPSQPGTPVDYVVNWPTTTYLVKGVKVYINTDLDLGRWEEIDAIALHGTWGFPSIDCNTNGTPDECEPDCNANGVADGCDLAAGTSDDCNADGKPDECQLNAPTPYGIPVSPLQAVSNTLPPAAHAFVVFKTGPVYDVDVGVTMAHTWVSDVEITVSHGGTSATLFSHECGEENNFAGTVWDDEADGPIDCTSGHKGTFRPFSPLSVFDGMEASGEWTVTVTDTESGDDGSWSAWSLSIVILGDCNSNGTPDDCDISAGSSDDCNVDGTPDECEPDCNVNGTSDACDIGAGTSDDCNVDGTPDECELAGNDCNTNGAPDDCDISAGASDDCNGNGTPDECELVGNDCNANGTLDICELTGLASYIIPVSPSLVVASTSPPATHTFLVADAGTVQDVDVGLTLTHGWVSDVVITVSHEDTSVTLFSHQCGSENDFTGTVWDDEAGESIACVAGHAGTFLPLMPLSAFDGMEASGEWTMTVADAEASDDGRLSAWSLSIGLSGTVAGGDFDADGTVGLSDYQGMVACLAGPEVTPDPPVSACIRTCLAAFDFDSDGDVDLADFTAFEVVFAP